MNLRPISLYTAGVVMLGVLGAAGYVAWPGHHSATLDPGSNRSFAAVSQRHENIEPKSTSVLKLLPTVSGSALQWSPMTALIALQRERVDLQHRDRARPQVSRAVARPTLDLRLPADIASDVALADQQPTTDFSGARHAPRGTDSLAMDLNPHIDERDIDSYADSRLFNRNNGLRGFMAQSWLTGNVGLQGGLAIKEERLRAENSTLQDNMAVGMGVLLAF